MEQLSDAQVLLLAAQLAATPDLNTLRVLAATRQDILFPHIVYRTLFTYLPLDADEEVLGQLVILLQDLAHHFDTFNSLDASTNDDHLNAPNAQEAEQSLSELRLERVPVYGQDGSEDLLTDFLIAWIHKIEGFSGLPTSILTLLDQFTAEHAMLRQWADTFLRPLHRLQTEFYPERASGLCLRDLETTSGSHAVDTLLNFAAREGPSADVGRDLDEIVAPWIVGSSSHKRRRLSTPAQEKPQSSTTTWGDVNRWLLGTAQKDYGLATKAAEQWNGPSLDATSTADEHNLEQDNIVAYVRAILAMIYVSDGDDDFSRVKTKKSLLRRAANLVQLMPPDFDEPLPDILDASHLSKASRTELFHNALLNAQNTLTRPSTDVIDFLYGVLSTQSLLNDLKIESSTQSVTATVLFESEEKQKQELRTILNQIPRLTRSNFSWPEIRPRLLWLRTWSRQKEAAANQPPIAFLGRLSEQYLEEQIVDAMLAASEYPTVQETYLANNTPLAKGVVKARALDAIHGAYDNASNGNRNRGGVKRALEIIQAFRALFEDTPEFSRLDHLIRATHSLSFYQLTLQYGVPFQPVSIRVSHDPLSLLEKVLDQNNKAYTKLDDLLGIARNLVLADLPTPLPADYAPGEIVPLERRLFDAEHRITFSAITAALSDHDFDTAYSLITTRFKVNNPRESPSTFADDTSWRAAYTAGRYRPSTSPQDIHKQIASLQQRMELLSKALTWAPTSEPLPEILAAWRRCEEEVDGLRSQALQEERALDAQTDDVLPGAFGPSDRDLDANETKRLLESRRAYNSSAPSYEEEAPMGLFDVARGAASALRKNAFPLRGVAGQTGVQVRDQPRSSMEGYQSMTSSGELERPGSADGQRVRKRDMISNAVTGGLVSGMSWVLGAQPVGREGQAQGGERDDYR